MGWGLNMKFGKLPDISNVDFSLPNDLIGNASFFENLKKENTLPKIFVGCTGWSMKEIPQSISHSRELGASSEYLKLFCESILGLREKLGCCFMQLPPYFGTERLPILENFLKRFPKEIRLAIELRHESIFFEKNKNRVFELLNKYNIGWVITDVAGRRDVLHMGVTTDIAMIRFVGNNLHPSDYQRIDAWVEKLKSWTANGLKEDTSEGAKCLTYVNCVEFFFRGLKMCEK